jgi:hypothetical protein
MTARAIWDEIVAGGWSLLAKWRVAAKPENVHLEFKQGTFVDGDVARDDLSNLAREISALANSEGGVLIFGAGTTKGPSGEDVLQRLNGVSPLDTYAERMRVRALSITTPSVSGLDVRVIADATRPNTGVVAVYVPLTDGAPYRAEGPDPRENKRYFIRVATVTDVMSHQLLAAMFGRSPHPRFRFGIRYQSADGRVELWLENVGPGMATMPLVRVAFERRGADPIGLHFEKQNPWQDRHSEIHHGTGEALDVAAMLPHDSRLYPRERRRVGTIMPSDRGARTIRVRVDCENAPPFELEQRVEVSGEDFVWLPSGS